MLLSQSGIWDSYKLAGWIRCYRISISSGCSLSGKNSKVDRYHIPSRPPSRSTPTAKLMGLKYLRSTRRRKSRNARIYQNLASFRWTKARRGSVQYSRTRFEGTISYLKLILLTKGRALPPFSLKIKRKACIMRSPRPLSVSKRSTELREFDPLSCSPMWKLLTPKGNLTRATKSSTMRRRWWWKEKHRSSWMGWLKSI